MKKFTVIIVAEDGFGTHHIDSYEAASMDEAVDKAKLQALRDWESEAPEGEAQNVHVMGVLAGEVEVLHWDETVFN